MADLPYVINPGSLTKFFDTIQKSGTPDKVTYKYLESIGFKSKNDRYLVGFLKDLGFVKSDGSPSELWLAYRHTGEAKGVMAAAVKNGWAGLFQLYPDAHRKDDEAIRNWMRTRAPSASPITVDRSLKAMKSAVNLAEFAEVGSQVAASVAAASSAPHPVAFPPPLATVPALSRQSTPEVVINIQLEIPATNDPETYDRFFAAMRKHLFPGDE